MREAREASAWRALCSRHCCPPLWDDPLMPAAARSKMRHTRVFRSRRSSAPLHNICNKHMRNNTHLLMQHGMHNMCNALRIRADEVESVLRVFFIHNNTIAMGFCNAYNIHIKMAQGHAHCPPLAQARPHAARLANPPPGLPRHARLVHGPALAHATAPSRATYAPAHARARAPSDERNPASCRLVNWPRAIIIWPRAIINGLVPL